MHKTGAYLIFKTKYENEKKFLSWGYCSQTTAKAKKTIVTMPMKDLVDFIVQQGHRYTAFFGQWEYNNQPKCSDMIRTRLHNIRYFESLILFTIFEFLIRNHSRMQVKGAL